MVGRRSCFTRSDGRVRAAKRSERRDDVKRALVALTATAFIALPVATGSASGGGDDIRNPGTCTGSSSSKIKGQARQRAESRSS